jgi:hypothetical protein
VRKRELALLSLVPEKGEIRKALTENFKSTT